MKDLNEIAHELNSDEQPIKELQLSKLLQLPESKIYADQFAGSIIEEVESGNANPLEVFIRIAILEKSLSEAKEAIKAAAISESEKYGKSFEFLGVKVERKEAGTKYDYSACNDIEIGRLENMLKDDTTALKSRQKFLQSIPFDSEVYNDEGTRIFAPIKSSTTTIAITIK